MNLNTFLLIIVLILTVIGMTLAEISIAYPNLPSWILIGLGLLGLLVTFGIIIIAAMATQPEPEKGRYPIRFRGCLFNGTQKSKEIGKRNEELAATERPNGTRYGLERI